MHFLCILGEGDITEHRNCNAGYVCYKSEWDINSLQSKPNKIPAEQCKSNQMFCIKPGYDDICSQLTTIVTSQNCGNASLQLIKNITVGMCKE